MPEALLPPHTMGSHDHGSQEQIYIYVIIREHNIYIWTCRHLCASYYTLYLLQTVVVFVFDINTFAPAKTYVFAFVRIFEILCHSLVLAAAMS